MKITILVSGWEFGFRSFWWWKGSDHGIPYHGECGYPDYVTYYYGWFYVERPADPADFMLRNIEKGMRDKFMEWNCVENELDYLLKSEEWIPKRKFKKLVKRFSNGNV